MVAPAVPGAKLISLFIKTLAKPMAKRVKHQFVKQPITRRSLIWIGQTSHAMSMRLTIWSSGFKVRSITPLEEDKALSTGADFISEAFIFSVSGGILVYEYNRSKEKEEKKEAARLQKIRDDASILQAKLNSVDKRLVALEEYAKANRSSILGMGLGTNGQYHEPEEVVPINDGKLLEAVEGRGSSSLNDDENKRTNENDSSAANNNLSNTNQQSYWKWLWPF